MVIVRKKETSYKKNIPAHFSMIVVVKLMEWGSQLLDSPRSLYIYLSWPIGKKQI